MRALLDTNVFARHANRADPRQVAITAALDDLLAQRIELCVCSQNIVEFWALSTRSVAANGLGREPRQLRPELDALLAGFTLVADPPGLLPTWLDLCTSHEVRGRQVYDARLVALMLASGITGFVTLNPLDFSRYPMIELIVPGT